VQRRRTAAQRLVQALPARCKAAGSPRGEIGAEQALAHAMASLPAVLDDAVFRCVRKERPALAAAVEAARAGPQQLMVRAAAAAALIVRMRRQPACALSTVGDAQDFLILAGTAASPETLHGVQELADKLSQEQGALPRRALKP
jgi:hypothetical protein